MSNIFDELSGYSKNKPPSDSIFDELSGYSERNLQLEIEEPSLQPFEPPPVFEDEETQQSISPLDPGRMSIAPTQTVPPVEPTPDPAFQESVMTPGESFVDEISRDPVEPFQAEFTVQRGMDVPKDQRTLSTDPSRNGILNSLKYFDGLDNDSLIQEYARQVVNEAHLPMGDRPKNEKYALKNKRMREMARTYSSPEEYLERGLMDEFASEAVSMFEDPDFISPKRYADKLVDEETKGFDKNTVDKIKEQINFFRPIAEGMSPEDLIRDTSKSNSVVVNFLGDAAGIFTFPVVMAGSVGATFMGSGGLGPRKTTLAGEQIGEGINAAKTYTTSRKVRNYRKKADKTGEAEAVVYNIAEDGSPGASDIQGYSELSLRGPRSETYEDSPKYMPHEIAVTINAIEKDKDKIKERIRNEAFQARELERFRRTPGQRMSLEATDSVFLDKTFEDAVDFLFVRNKAEIPGTISNQYAVWAAENILSDYLPENTEGEKLGKLLEEAEAFYDGTILRAVSNEDTELRKSFEKVAGTKDINISKEEFQRRVNEYVFNEIQRFSEQAAKEGVFGENWSESELKSKAAGIVVSTFNAQNRPEFKNALSEYGSRFSDAIFSEETFNDMVLDSWLGWLPGASDEEKARTNKKWLEHPLYAALDLAAVGVVVGKIGKVSGLSARAFRKGFAAAKAGNPEPLRRLIRKAWVEEKKHIETVKIRPDKDKYAETNFEQPPGERPVELNLSNADEATILYSDKKAAEYRKMAEETDDPALKQQLEKDALAEEQLAQSKVDYYGGLKTEEGGTATFADDPIPETFGDQLPTGRRYAERGESLRGKSSEQRVESFYNESLDDVKIIDELYKESPQDAARAEARISAEVAEVAKSNNIVPDNTKGLINALIDAGYTDPQFYRHVIYNSTSETIKKTAETVANVVAQAKEFSYRMGTQAKKTTIKRVIDESPISVLADSAKTGKDEFLNRRDSLVVGEQLSLSGATRPSAYYGLNLMDGEIDKFIELAKTRKQKKAVVQSKLKRNPDHAIDVDGNFIGFKDVNESRSPTKIANVSEDLYVEGGLINVLGKAGKTVGRILGQQFGRAPYRLFQEGKKRAGDQVYYTYMATMEYLQNPFAVFNVPNLYRNAASELLRFAYVNGHEGFMTRALQAMVKPSLEAGDLYFELRQIAELGRMSEDEFNRLINELPDFEKNHIVEESLIVESLGKSAASDYNPVSIPGEDLETTFINIHAGLDQPLPDGTVPSQLFGIEVDMTKRFVRKIEEIESKLANAGPAFLKTKRGQAMMAEGRELQAKLDAGDVYLKVEDPYFGDRGVTNAQQYKDAGGFRLYAKVSQDQMTDYQKAIYSIVEQRLLPAQEKVFNLVGQIVSGADSQRIVLESSPAPKKMVVRIKRDANGETYELVKDFTQMEDGVQQAQAMLNDLSAKEVSREFDPKLREVEDKLRNKQITEEQARMQRDKIEQEIAVRKSSGSVNYLLLNEDGFAARKAYGKDYLVSAVKNPYISFDKNQYLARTIQYISTYQETQGILKVIKRHLDEIAESGLEGAQLEAKREEVMRKMLSLVPDGKEMLKEAGNDARKVFEKLINMSDADQQKTLGRVMSPEERFFFKQSSESGFTKAELLESFANYKFSLTQTMIGLQGNLNLAKSFNLLRNKGQLITKSEFEALKKTNPAAANMFMEAGNVQSRKPSQVVTMGTTQQVKEPTESIFGTTMDGFYISKPAASFMSKQAGLQDLAEKMSTKALQAFKFSKIIDPLGGAYLRNIYSAVSFHGYGAGPVVSNPLMAVKFYNDYKRIIKGQDPKDPRVLAIIKAGAGMASEKKEISVTMDARERNARYALTTFLMDTFSKNGDLPNKIAKITNKSPESFIDDVVDILSLEGREKEMNRFLQEIKAETRGDAVRIGDLDKITGIEKMGRIAEKTGQAVFSELLDLYSGFDRHMAGGYALQLMDKYSLSAMDALRIADEVFVDYMDMSSILNVFRYEAAFGIAGMPFVGYTANGVNLAARMLTEGTSRSWLAAHLVQANDTAVEGMLDLGMSMQEYGLLFQDPTMKLFPYEYATESVGTEFRGQEVPGEGFLSGVAGASLSSILPFPIDAKILARGVPSFDQDKEIVAHDILQSFFGTIGGPLDELIRKFKVDQQDSFRVQKAKLLQKEIEKLEERTDISDSHKEKIMRLIRLDPLSRIKEKGDPFEEAAKSLLIPTIGMSAYRLLGMDGPAPEGSAATKALGIKVVPYSTRQILSSRLLDADTKREAKANIEVGINLMKDLNTGKIDYPGFNQGFAKYLKKNLEVDKQIEEAKTDVNRALLIKLQQEMELITDKAMYLYLSGNISENELDVILSTLK